MTVLTLNITEPKNSVHLTPSLDRYVREIKVIDFLCVRRPYISLPKPQRLFNVDNNYLELNSLNDGDYTLDVLKRSLKAIDKGIEMLESNGDWYKKSSFKLDLGKQLYTQLRVPRILTPGKLYPLIWNCPSLFVYCDIVESHDSYSNTTVGATPSK